jgi:hypothetical protein
MVGEGDPDPECLPCHGACGAAPRGSGPARAAPWTA